MQSIEEVKYLYEYIFKITDKNGDGLIEINEAVDLFRKSGLPSEQLKIIWDLSGINSTTLQRNQFFTALSLIAQAQNGKSLQVNANEVSTPVFEGIVYPAYDPDWSIPPSKLNTYESYFKQADTENKGFISGEVARDLFIKSGLSNQILASIWSLSDLDSDGKLNLIEFSIAMHLINMCLRGFEVPKALPNKLLSSLNMKEAKLKIKEKTSVERQDSTTNIASSNSQFMNSFQDDFLLMDENKQKEEILLKKRLEEENRIQQDRQFESLRREEEERRIQEQRKFELLKQQEEERRKHEEIKKEELMKLEMLRQQEQKRQEEEKMRLELQKQEEMRRLEELHKQETLRKQKELEDMKKEIILMIQEKLNLTNDLRSIQSKKFLLANQLATMEQEGESIRNEVGTLELEIEKIKIKGANIREKLDLCARQIETLQEQKEQMEAMTEERQEVIREEETKILILESQINKNKEALDFQKSNIEKMKKELINLKNNKDYNNEKSKIDSNINMKSTQNFPFPDFGEKKDVEENSSNSFGFVENENHNPFKTSKTKPSFVSEHAFLDDFGSSVKERGTVVFRELPSIINEKDQFGKIMAKN